MTANARAAAQLWTKCKRQNLGNEPKVRSHSSICPKQTVGNPAQSQTSLNHRSWKSQAELCRPAFNSGFMAITGLDLRCIAIEKVSDINFERIGNTLQHKYRGSANATLYAGYICAIKTAVSCQIFPRQLALGSQRPPPPATLV